MPTAQEQRCVSALCDHLSQSGGERWDVIDWLDRSHHQSASPDALISNGTRTLGVEVKRLTGGEVWETYRQSIDDLRSRLLPPSGGRYWLYSSAGFDMLLARPLSKHLRAEIERVADKLGPGDSLPIEVPRTALLKRMDVPADGLCICWHTSSREYVERASARLPGYFYLDDEGQPEHRFETEAALDRFVDIVVEASDSGVDETTIEWSEEWVLERSEIRPDYGEGVGISTVVIDDAVAASKQAVLTAVTAAIPKFASRSWADIHALLLDFDDRPSALPPDYLADAVRALRPSDVGRIDSFFLLADGAIVLEHRLQSSAAS